MTNQLQTIGQTAQVWPRTLSEAVERLAQALTQDEEAKVAATPEEDLIWLNYDFGAHIRRAFGLWEGNKALVEACGVGSPEDATMVIIRALWGRLRH